MSDPSAEEWELGQHPAIANGWIVRPVLFGSRAYALPASEGGHIVIRDERAARLIASAPKLLAALKALLADSYPVGCCENVEVREQAIAAINEAEPPHD